MADTPIYALPYESINDTPGVSLRAPGPILAEQVEGELARIDSGIVSLDSDFDALRATVGDRARVIATIDTGSGTGSTSFTSIPQTFRDLQILWHGRSDGSGQLDSLALRFNGDTGNNYDSRLSRNTGDNYTSSTGTFSVLRAGHVGTYRSVGCVWIPAYSRANVMKFVTGTSYARGAASSANTYTTSAGGHWTSTAAINAIQVWVSGQLWSGNPSITLIGYP